MINKGFTIQNMIVES